MADWLVGLRQLSYPPEFRIRAPEGDDWAATLVGQTKRLLNRPAAPRVDHGFAIALCNECYRLELRVKALQENLVPGDRESLTMLSRAIEELDELLQEHQIEYLDLSGEVYTLERKDFEPIAPPKTGEGLGRAVIARCDRPAVYVDDKLVQPAKGLVAIP